MTAAQVRYRPADLWLFGSTLMLTVIGLWMSLDTSYPKTLSRAKGLESIVHLLYVQIAGAAIGLMALFFCMLISPLVLRRIAVPGAITGIALLALVWAPHLGARLNMSYRWIKIGSVMIQSSELAKILLLIYAADRLASAVKRVRRPGWNEIWPVLLVSSITLLLIEKEPDLGTAFVLFMAVFVQLYLAGVRKRHLAVICMVCLTGVLLFGMHGKGLAHRQQRIVAFLHPQYDPEGIGYQVQHARLAVGSGELYGEGFGHGLQKYYLPQANSDFVFATYAEETGFAGSILLLILLLMVCWRGFLITLRCRSEHQFEALLAGGITALIGVQALTNIAVATGSIPATGVPLPFVSHGSSSLVVLMCCVGLLLNIGQRGRETSLAQRQPAV